MLRSIALSAHEAVLAAGGSEAAAAAAEAAVMAARKKWNDEELRRELQRGPPSHDRPSNDRGSQGSAPSPPGSRHLSEASPELASRLLIEPDNSLNDADATTLAEDEQREGGAMHRRESEDADEPRTGNSPTTPPSVHITPQSVMYGPGESWERAERAGA
eukprot:CAMPEP_0119478102 /NCGR_PEP_ID=MMETSP1344-20130328/7995_1 /TAXON_ID=236787 /ORGANISM="Florenciella parvula, Strain CCMP2471" /LENGTH=159 /DNA_ID=CAMNT_0007512251 /DNA_START=640 /DNA_END=1116 /DNA_ORIENTATION=-